MTDPDRMSTVEAARTLVESMNSLGGEIGALRHYGRRNRQMIVLLAISLLLDALLSVAVFFVAVQASQASSEAARNRQNAITTCEASNQARVASVQLWNYVLDTTVQSPSPDPDRPAKIEKFRQFMKTTYAPRDCTLPK